MKRTLRVLMLAGVAALAASSAARADFDIQVFVGGNLVDTISKGGSLDLSPSAGTITVDTNGLNTDLTNAGYGIQFSSLSASSTFTDPHVARLSANGQVSESTVGATETVTVLASFSGYNLPVGAARSFTSSNSDNFSLFGPGTTRDFTSYFISAPGPVNSIAGTASPLLTFTPTTIKTSDGQDSAATVVPYSGQFTLTNVSDITLSSTAGSGLALDNFGGTTTVRAVPEPASMGLVLLGGVAFVVRARRKRAA